MRQRTTVLAAGALLLGLAGPLSAQSRDNNSDGGWWPWAGAEWEDRERDDRDRDDRRVDDRRGDKAGRGAAKKGNGPPFCRNGQGHPVHGRAWCERKGWSQAGWGDVIYRSRVPRERRLEQPTLRDILGDVVFG